MISLQGTFPKPCAEQWEDMTAAGCNRHCATCDKTILDLAQMTIGEVETLVDAGEEICVRAQIDTQGKVLLKSDAWRDTRRMIATVGAGAGLLASGFAAASPKLAEGTIAGKVENSDWDTRATATGADGKSYSARVKNNGRYKIKHVPPGAYKMTFSAECSEPWESGTVIVADGEKAIVNTTENDTCIIVGLLEFKIGNG